VILSVRAKQRWLNLGKLAARAKQVWLVQTLGWAIGLASMAGVGVLLIRIGFRTFFGIEVVFIGAACVAVAIAAPFVFAYQTIRNWLKTASRI
jgi:hypothetical protein